MRPVLVTDVLALARVLVQFAAVERPEVARKLITQTELADLYRRKVGKSHPFWGDGSLSCRCLLANPAVEPGPDDTMLLEALATAASLVSRRLPQRGVRMALV